MNLIGFLRQIADGLKIVKHLPFKPERSELEKFIPIFSYDKNKIPDFFHPVDCPDSKSDFCLLKASDFPFLTRDSVLKLNDIRSVSVNRILYQHQGSIDPSSDYYQDVIQRAFQKYFPDVFFEYQKDKEEIKRLNALLAELTK